MKGAEVQGATNDVLARAGEGLTMRVGERRCSLCGGRLEEVLDSYTRKTVLTRCRGCSGRAGRAS